MYKYLQIIMILKYFIVIEYNDISIVTNPVLLLSVCCYVRNHITCNSGFKKHNLGLA